MQVKTVELYRRNYSLHIVLSVLGATEDVKILENLELKKLKTHMIPRLDLYKQDGTKCKACGAKGRNLRNV